MDKQRLIGIGLTEAQAAQVEELLKENRNGSMELELKQLRETLSQRDAQIAALKAFEGDAAKLKEELSSLQKRNNEDKARMQAELISAQKSFAVKQELLELKRRPHDVDLALSLIDLSKVSIDPSGKIVGLKEQADLLYASKPFLFASEVAPVASIQGLNIQSKSAVAPVQASSGVGSLGKQLAEHRLSMLGVAKNHEGE